MQDYNWVIRTADGDILAFLKAGTFEDAYLYAVNLWNALTTDTFGDTHCDGLEICSIEPADDILGTPPTTEVRLQINYVTHER